MKNKKFLNLKIGDKVLCVNDSSHDIDYHVLKIDSYEYDKEYITEANPQGKRYFGTDLDYVDKYGNFDESDNNYLTVVDEGNFIGVIPTWIVATNCTENDGTVGFNKVTGTIDEVKKYLVKLVKEAKANEEDEHFEYGTEDIEEIGETLFDKEIVELNAYAIFDSYQMNFQARLLDSLNDEILSLKE